MIQTCADCGTNYAPGDHGSRDCIEALVAQRNAAKENFLGAADLIYRTMQAFARAGFKTIDPNLANTVAKVLQERAEFEERVGILTRERDLLRLQQERA